MNIKQLLRVRRRQKARKPTFNRPDYHKKKRLGDSWRKPRGIHNKTRRHYKGKCPVVRPGYGSPAKVKGMHPSGYWEVLVHTPREVEGIDAETTAIRIAGSVGKNKRAKIEALASELGIKVLNPTIDKEDKQDV